MKPAAAHRATFNEARRSWRNLPAGVCVDSQKLHDKLAVTAWRSLHPGAGVNDRDRKKTLARRIEADSLLPPLGEKDSVSINFRKILVEREELGFPRVSLRALNAIKEQGYDAFFIGQMNSYTKIGLSLFHRLAAMDRIEITTEYIVFHHFRESLTSDCRRRIAILLLSKTQSQPRR